MNKKITNLLKCMVILLLLLTISLLSVTLLQSRDNIHPLEKAKPVSIIGFYHMDQGPWQELTPDTSFDTNMYHTVTIRGRFSQDIPKELEVLFYIRNLDVSLKINHHTVYEFGDSKNSFPFHSSGIAWSSVYSNGISKDTEIELTMANTYLYAAPSFRDLLDNIKVGHYSQLYTEYISENSLILVIGSFAILLGVLALFLALIAKTFHLPQTSKAAALSFFAMATGLWILLSINYLCVPLLIPLPLLAAFCNILSIYLMPAAVFLLILVYSSPKIKPIVSIIAIAQYTMILSFFFLQMLGIVQLYESQTFGIILNPIFGIGPVILVIYDVCVNKDWEERIMLLTICPCIIGLLLETANYFIPFLPKYIFSAFGCLITLILQVLQIIYMIKLSSQVLIHTQQLENELLQSRISTMLSQIQPHFLYNTLTAISHLCGIDGLKAKQAIIEFSTYLRGNLDFLSERSLEPFQMELNHIKVYLSLEKMRFEDQLNIVYDISVNDFLLPLLTVQPIVENAVRYGIGKKENGGTVRISTRETETAFQVIVSDDGIGFDPNSLKKDGRSHIGIQNVKSRLSAQCKGTLIIESVIGVGTTVTITIPKENKKNPPPQY